MTGIVLTRMSIAAALDSLRDQMAILDGDEAQQVGCTTLQVLHTLLCCAEDGTDPGWDAEAEAPAEDAPAEDAAAPPPEPVAAPPPASRMPAAATTKAPAMPEAEPAAPAPAPATFPPAHFRPPVAVAAIPALDADLGLPADDVAEAEAAIRQAPHLWPGRKLADYYGWPIEKAAAFAQRVRAAMAAEKAAASEGPPA